MADILNKKQVRNVEKAVNDCLVVYISQLTDSFLMRIKDVIDREIERRSQL